MSKLLSRIQLGNPQMDPVTESYRIPQTTDGLIHIQKRKDGSPPSTWVKDTGSNVYQVLLEDSSGAEIVYEPNAIAMMIALTLADASRQVIWQDSAGGTTQGTLYTQAANGGPVTMYVGEPANVIKLTAVGIAKFPLGLHRFGTIAEIDLAGAGFAGPCDYLGDLPALTTVDISGNPDYVHDPDCFIDNGNLALTR